MHLATIKISDNYKTHHTANCCRSFPPEVLNNKQKCKLDCPFSL
jgi:hypothetical protein